jgi:acetyl-CoA acetyltransferase
VPDAFIAAATRAPVGRRGDVLSQVHPADLGGHVIRALVQRAGVDLAAVDDVLLGCVTQGDPQSTKSGADAGPRRDSTRAALSALKPSRRDGVHRKAVASPNFGRGRALTVGFGSRGSSARPDADRVDPLDGRGRIRAGSHALRPVSATNRNLSRSALGVDDIGLFEVNEAFAAVVLAWLQIPARRLSAWRILRPENWRDRTRLSSR